MTKESVIYKMEQVNSIVSNAIINPDGSVPVTFSIEQFFLIKKACKNYSDKLDCARRHYHKYKKLKGRRDLDEATLRMASINGDC